MILNESLFELKIIDLPVVPYFPPDNIAEWTDFKYYGLRSASAYILVYDASVPATFQFIKTLRDQMFQTRDMTNVPILVVANKMDMEASRSCSRISSTVTNNHPSSSHHFSTIVSHHSVMSKDRDHYISQHHRIHSHHHSHHSHGNKCEQHRESGGTGGMVTGTTAVSGAGSAATVLTCATTDSFYHHSKQLSNAQINNTLLSGTTAKPNSGVIQNGINNVSKTTKGISRCPDTVISAKHVNKVYLICNLVLTTQFKYITPRQIIIIL